MAKKCPPGKYYCFTDKKCKKIPRGYHIGARGYLARGDNRSATFQVQVTRGTQYHMTTINVIHDGTNAFLSEYGTIRTGEILATFDADISGGNLRLRVTPTSTASTVFKLSKTVIKV